MMAVHATCGSCGAIATSTCVGMRPTCSSTLRTLFKLGSMRSRMSVWLSGTTSGAVNGRCAVVSQDSIGVEAAFTKHEVTVAEHTPRALAGSDVEMGPGLVGCKGDLRDGPHGSQRFFPKMICGRCGGTDGVTQDA